MTTQPTELRTALSTLLSVYPLTDENAQSVVSSVNQWLNAYSAAKKTAGPLSCASFELITALSQNYSTVLDAAMTMTDGVGKLSSKVTELEKQLAKCTKGYAKMMIKLDKLESCSSDGSDSSGSEGRDTAKGKSTIGSKSANPSSSSSRRAKGKKGKVAPTSLADTPSTVGTASADKREKRTHRKAKKVFKNKKEQEEEIGSNSADDTVKG